MNIRSLTGFLALTDPIGDSALRGLGDLVRAARAEFSAAGFPLQTARVATQSLDSLRSLQVSEIKPRDLTAFARALEAACKANGIDYASLGAIQADTPATSATQSQYSGEGAPKGEGAGSDAALNLIAALPAALRATENIFASVQIASRAHGINFRAIAATARVIHTLANTTPDGFGNFRFAALANCAPHAPFFPVAYQRGDAPAFALAAETAPLAVDAFSRAQNLDDARANFISVLERAAENITRVADELAARHAFQFLGIDFSTAPFPQESHSIGHAIEKLIGAEFGEHGTLFAAAFITDCIARAQFKRAGLNGLMLPVLEDSTLAARSAQITIYQLLLYSTVCGTGLDTVPLPGDTRADQIAAVLLDLTTLAVKHDKPLTARLIPIPGLSAGDATKFDFEYFANARVLPVNGRALKIFESDRQIDFKR